MLRVNEDNVQMSVFIENTLETKFENGRAFYQLTKMEEDLLFYKEVVQMPKVIDIYLQNKCSLITVTTLLHSL